MFAIDCSLVYSCCSVAFPPGDVGLVVVYGYDIFWSYLLFILAWYLLALAKLYKWVCI